MFIKIQLFSFHSYCHALAAARFISILLSHFYIFTYPSTTSLCLVHFFFHFSFRPTKIIIVIKQSFTHNLSMLNNSDVVGLSYSSSSFFFLFLLDVNFTYSISIFCSTDNIFIFLCNLHTVAVAIYKIIRGREKEQWKIIKICGYISLDWDEKKKHISNLRLAFFSHEACLFCLLASVLSVHSTNQHLLSSACSFSQVFAVSSTSITIMYTISYQQFSLNSRPFTIILSKIENCCLCCCCYFFFFFFLYCYYLQFAFSVFSHIFMSQVFPFRDQKFVLYN